MEEGKENFENLDSVEREEIFSKAVRAGKRTYFFDVKATRKNDFYLTLTESKKRYDKDGRFVYEKHKIFLYKEDFEKFLSGLNEAIEVIQQNNHENLLENELPDQVKQDFTNVDFDDLIKNVVTEENNVNR